MNDDIDDNDDDISIDSDDSLSLSSSDDLSGDAGDLTARDMLRRQLQSDVEAFLAAGGQISHVPTNVTADPPKKPQSNYGGQPI